MAAAAEAVRRIIEEGDGYVPAHISAAGGSNDTRSDDDEGKVEEIVPCTSGLAIGRVIGKQGSTVMRIEEETGARLQLDQRLLECVITGYPEQVEAAARRVRQVMSEGEGGNVVRIPCTGSEGLIIGPRGSRVRRIAADTKARLSVEKVSDIASECLIQGSPQAVAMAADIVTELMETEEFYGDYEDGGYS